MATVTLLLASAVWGWTFVLVKDALWEVGPLWFLALRFTAATVLAVPLLLGRRGSRSRHNWRWGAILGLALFGGYFLQTWGLVYTTAQKSGLITGLSVVLVPVVAWATGGRPSGRAWAGVALAGGGVTLLALGGESLAGGAWFGDLLTALCAVAFAVHLVLLGRYAKAGDPRALLFPQVAVVALLSLAGAGGTEEVTFALSSQVWIAVGVTAALATTGAFALVLWAGRRASATRMAIVLATEPVFAALFGWWLLGERLHPPQALGAALVLAGILSQRS
ncbi:MAG: DMT family transporter [Candidatus Bipolaricaulota bacterium]|nr:DMT family transporter [Candidatus Bipolaricaulota bacterium]